MSKEGFEFNVGPEEIFITKYHPECPFKHTTYGPVKLKEGNYIIEYNEQDKTIEFFEVKE